MEVKGFGATGYAADVLKESVKSDANIVETVAHMMSATHYFGDIDVICDIGGQDIKVLFMQNGDIKNFRLSNQCSAGNGMLLQAMADQFGVKVTDYADVAFEAKLSPKFSYGCAVFLDSRSRELPEGGLLEGGAARRASRRCCRRTSGSTSCRSRAWRSWARSSCCRAGRSTTWPRSRRRSTTSRRAFPAPRSTSTRTRGEAGAIGAAMETRRVVMRKGYSTFIGIDAAINLEFQAVNDESTRCHFCPNNCARTFIDTKTPDGRTVALHLGLLLREGHRRVRRGDDRAHQGAQEADEGVPEPGRLRVEAGVPALLRSGADARGDGDDHAT